VTTMPNTCSVRSCFNMPWAGWKCRVHHKDDRPELGTPCAVCGRTDEQLHWDHNHKTGKTRGSLCSMCNAGLG
jgi:hypothetical protein